MRKLIDRRAHVNHAGVWHIGGLVHGHVHVDDWIGVEIDLTGDRVDVLR